MQVADALVLECSKKSQTSKGEMLLLISFCRSLNSWLHLQLYNLLCLWSKSIKSCQLTWWGYAQSLTRSLTSNRTRRQGLHLYLPTLSSPSTKLNHAANKNGYAIKNVQRQLKAQLPPMTQIQNGLQIYFRMQYHAFDSPFPWSVM